MAQRDLSVATEKSLDLSVATEISLGHTEIALWPQRDLSVVTEKNLPVATERLLCGHKKCHTQIALWPQRDLSVATKRFRRHSARDCGQSQSATSNQAALASFSQPDSQPEIVARPPPELPGQSSKTIFAQEPEKSPKIEKMNMKIQISIGISLIFIFFFIFLVSKNEIVFNRFESQFHFFFIFFGREKITVKSCVF